MFTKISFYWTIDTKCHFSILLVAKVTFSVVINVFFFFSLGMAITPNTKRKKIYLYIENSCVSRYLTCQLYTVNVLHYILYSWELCTRGGGGGGGDFRVIYRKLSWQNNWWLVQSNWNLVHLLPFVWRFHLCTLKYIFGK